MEATLTHASRKIWERIRKGSALAGLSVSMVILSSVLLGVSSLSLWKSRTEIQTFSTPAHAGAFVERWLERDSSLFNRLSFRDFPQARLDLSLTDPALAFPSTFRYPPDEIRPVINAAQTCRFPKLRLKDSVLRKALAWHRFLCGVEVGLPEGFFRRPPYLHPSGKSFVALAIDTRSPAFTTAEWVTSHLPYLHVSELPRYEPAGYSSTRGLLEELGREGVLALLSGERLVKRESHYFVITGPANPALEKRGSVVAVPAKRLDRYLASNGLRIIKNNSGACPSPQDQRCFAIDAAAIEKSNRWRYRLFTFAAGVTLLSFLILLVDFYRKRVKERAARLFALKVLTHELRTPAASIRLSVEIFRKRYDQLPTELQSEFLQLCEDAQRLRRLIDASSQYLTSGLQGGQIAYKMQIVSSLNDFVSATLEEYAGRIEIVLLPQDIGLSTDPYWLGICLKNVVNNALMHGAPPVSVTVQGTRSAIKIIVSDEGQLKTSRRGEIIPSPRSWGKGLGLGLEITRQILGGLKGKLLTDTNPTRFTILARRY